MGWILWLCCLYLPRYSSKRSVVPAFARPGNSIAVSPVNTERACQHSPSGWQMATARATLCSARGTSNDSQLPQVQGFPAGRHHWEKANPPITKTLITRVKHLIILMADTAIYLCTVILCNIIDVTKLSDKPWLIKKRGAGGMAPLYRQGICS